MMACSEILSENRLLSLCKLLFGTLFGLGAVYYKEIYGNEVNHWSV